MTIRHSPISVAARRVSSRAVGGGPRFDWSPVLWHHLESYPRLSSRFAVHRGIRWTSPNGARGKEAGAGCRRGRHGARHDSSRFRIPYSSIIDRYGSGGGPTCRGTVPSWRRTRLARQPHPGAIAAGLDSKGLACSEQFFGLRPKRSVTEAQPRS